MQSRLCLRVGLLALFILEVWATPTTSNPTRRATCTPISAGSSGIDDVPAIEAAFKSCGNGGIIVIPAGKTYAIRSTLDFTGCVNCDFQIEGTLKMSEDLEYWNGKAAVLSLNAITGAKMHSVTGTGLIDGNGVPYWIEFAANHSYRRPTLVSITGKSKSITISNLRFKNPANVFHSVGGGSTNILYDALRLDATSTSTATAKNTDGFDVGASTFVTIRNTTVVNQDDCVALKAGSNFALVTGITCTGSHGLSVGSLGGGAGSTDSVTNAFLGPATMIDSAKAVGIKLYEGGSAHGVASVSNVTWSGITVKNCDYAVQIQSCYSAADTTNCVANTDRLTDITFENFSGTTSTKYSPVVANLHCSASATCGVALKGFTVKAPSGTTQVQCSNIDGALGVVCSGAGSG
ncbi:extracellular exo-polygalacturonase [Mycena belliarum]|uniref:Extracellular exo-polygalacturonase n=1 Tax=Mycena belliarum TaxID=1033014 RepID=A0AAD6XN65_9AGAR|nr:extracellular exo-polygalacturonase [Mycena belliae]